MATATTLNSTELASIAPVVAQYFTSFNAADYRAVAALFAADGRLLAPFEEPIVGTEAIYAYLQAEATAMRATPLEIDADIPPVNETTPAEHATRQIVVKGRVKTRLFAVNVRWTFSVTAANTLQSAEIRLLASLQELVQLNPS